MFRRLPLLAMIPLCLTGCTSFSAASRTAFCDIAEPITWCIGDTPGTIQQIDRHNVAWVKLCNPAIASVVAAH